MNTLTGWMAWNNFIGKKVKVFFDDGSKVSFKEGTVIDANSDYIYFNEDDVIPTSRIIRVEVLD